MWRKSAPLLFLYITRYYMREFGLTVFILLAVVGLCAILGIATRGTDSSKDRDNALMSLLRGLGTLMALFAAITAIAAVIYIITMPFR